MLIYQYYILMKSQYIHINNIYVYNHSLYIYSNDNIIKCNNCKCTESLSFIVNDKTVVINRLTVPVEIAVNVDVVINSKNDINKTLLLITSHTS